MLYVWPQPCKTRTSFVLCEMLYLCCETSRREGIIKMDIGDTIKALESKYEWMKITKHDDGTYRIQDMRFGQQIPFNIYKDFIPEGQLLEELKWHISKGR